MADSMVASMVESWAENWAASKAGNWDVSKADYLVASMVALKAVLTADYWAA